jgi:hypothetical protein
VDVELEQLATALGLPREETERLVEEVRAVFDQTLPDFVKRRHAEYKRRMGLRNDEIYRRIREDVRSWRFRAPEITERQVRRMIYG